MYFLIQTRVHTIKFLLVFFLTAVGVAAYADKKPSILFLHLRYANNQFSIVKKSVVPGTAKTSLNPHGPKLDLELASSDGTVLWSDSVGDPSIRHFESEDPVHPGQLIS